MIAPAHPVNEYILGSTPQNVPSERKHRHRNNCGGLPAGLGGIGARRMKPACPSPDLSRIDWGFAKPTFSETTPSEPPLLWRDLR